MAAKGVYIDFSAYVGREGVVILQVPDVEPREVTDCVVRGFFISDGEWGAIDFDGVIGRSIARGKERMWLLTRDGVVFTTIKGTDNWDPSELPDSGVRGKALGPANLIRHIGNKVFVCGMSGQVYVQKINAKPTAKWQHMDQGLVGDEKLILEGLHGTAEDNLYVVGSGGAVAHWNGSKWTRIKVMTNVNLWCVRCIEDRVVIGGGNGIVIEGDGKKVWKVYQIKQVEDVPIYDIEYYKGKLYAAATDLLMVREGKSWSAVRHGLGKDADFLRLTLGEGRLWAMGSSRIASFDGKKWRAHPDPDNG